MERPLLLLWKYLNPVIVRVIDEIKPHGRVLKTYTIHFFVILPDGIIITGYAKAQMAFVFTQFIGCGMVFQPGQFQQKTCFVVRQVDQDERTVGSFLPTMFF